MEFVVPYVPTILAGSFLLFGFVWTGAFTTYFLRRRAFLKTALETTGTIIDVDVRHYRGKSFGSPGSTHHYPTVRFQTVDGRVVDCKINISLHDHYTNGQSVIVNYDAKNPCKRTQLGDRNSQPTGKFVLFIGVGVMILLVGLIMAAVQFAWR